MGRLFFFFMKNNYLGKNSNSDYLFLKYLEKYVLFFLIPVKFVLSAVLGIRSLFIYIKMFEVCVSEHVF